jgi:hypothetical protein
VEGRRLYVKRVPSTTRRRKKYTSTAILPTIKGWLSTVDSSAQSTTLPHNITLICRLAKTLSLAILRNAHSLTAKQHKHQRYAAISAAVYVMEKLEEQYHHLSLIPFFNVQ